ncbi:MAG: hypothetical protein R2713_07105 [Ilumatobacteraceae bacterium]
MEPHADRADAGYRGLVDPPTQRRPPRSCSSRTIRRTPSAATDLARFVEFVLVDGIDDSITPADVGRCLAATRAGTSRP